MEVSLRLNKEDGLRVFRSVKVNRVSRRECMQAAEKCERCNAPHFRREAIRA
jgi:hypothetical protein